MSFLATIIGMKKFFNIITLITTLNLAAFAEDKGVTASIEGGYSTEYLVYGVTYASDAPFAGFNIGAEYLGVDFGVNGKVLPSSAGLNQSVWGVGLGKAFKVADGFSVRATGNVNRYLTGSSIVADTTFADVGLALENKYFTPYVKGAYGVEVNQYGVLAGVYKTFSLFKIVDVTPTFEYGYFNDYQYYLGKIGISRVLFSHLEVFAEGAYVDNNFNTSAAPVNFAIKSLNNQLIGTGGVRWNF